MIIANWKCNGSKAMINEWTNNFLTNYVEMKKAFIGIAPPSIYIDSILDTKLSKLKEINIGSFMFLSKAENSTGGRNKSSIIEDAVEALIAALYFDGGLTAVNGFVSKYIYPSIKELSENPGQKDYKTRLQEYYAKVGKKVNYMDSSTGPDHDKKFQTQVFLDKEIIGVGEGKSKKSSQQEAAKQALEKINA